jgi:mRNA interferase MazF
MLTDWTAAGLNVVTAVKRGVFTIHDSLIIKTIGSLTPADAARTERALRDWLGL